MTPRQRHHVPRRHRNSRVPGRCRDLHRPPVHRRRPPTRPPGGRATLWMVRMERPRSLRPVHHRRRLTMTIGHLGIALMHRGNHDRHVMLSMHRLFAAHFGVSCANLGTRRFRRAVNAVVTSPHARGRCHGWQVRLPGIRQVEVLGRGGTHAAQRRARRLLLLGTLLDCAAHRNWRAPSSRSLSNALVSSWTCGLIHGARSPCDGMYAKWRTR